MDNSVRLDRDLDPTEQTSRESALASRESASTAGQSGNVGKARAQRASERFWLAVSTIETFSLSISATRSVQSN